MESPNRPQPDREPGLLSATIYFMVAVGTFLNTLTPILQIGFKELIKGYIDGKTSQSGNAGSPNRPPDSGNPDRPPASQNPFAR